MVNEQVKIYSERIDDIPVKLACLGCFPRQTFRHSGMAKKDGDARYELTKN
ncbi:MAG: hypothetical protein PUP93_01015 [Rhizonema sp. NSF051]|nr:hypothetical protein [Rhizonema sp. NSF051]